MILRLLAVKALFLISIALFLIAFKNHKIESAKEGISPLLQSLSSEAATEMREIVKDLPRKIVRNGGNILNSLMGRDKAKSVENSQDMAATDGNKTNITGQVKERMVSLKPSKVKFKDGEIEELIGSYERINEDLLRED